MSNGMCRHFWEEVGGKSAPRAPRMTRPHEPCRDCTHLSVDTFLLHLKNLPMYDEQVMTPSLNPDCIHDSTLKPARPAKQSCLPPPPPPKDTSSKKRRVHVLETPPWPSCKTPSVNNEQVVSLPNAPSSDCELSEPCPL